MSFKNKIKAITPLVCVMVYLLLGFVLGGTVKNIWWWGLLVFLLCPVMPYLLGEKKITLSVSFVIVVAYVLLGFISTSLGKPLWHPGWVIFLLIPIIHILMVPSPEKMKNKIKDKVFGKPQVEDKDDNIYDAK